jgi:hypothetical protein
VALHHIGMSVATPGSVAMTLTTSPTASPFTAAAVLTMGMGQRSPEVSSVSVGSGSPAGGPGWFAAGCVIARDIAGRPGGGKPALEEAKAIAAKQFKTRDEDKQREQMAPRLDWREFVGAQYVREVTLKPMP